MGWKDSLKSAIFTDDEPKPGTDGTATAGVKPPPFTPPPASVFGAAPFASVSTVSAPVAAEDPGVMTLLSQVVAGAPNGRSYTEFLKILDPLARVISIEGQRYQVALVSGGANGHTTAEVLKSLDSIIDALKTHARSIHAEAPQKLAEKVGRRQQEKDQAQAALQARQQELARLQQEVAALTGDLATKTAAITKEQGEQAEKLARYDGTSAIVVRRYETERQKIAQYGEGVN